MKNTLKARFLPYKTLTLASVRMYFRNRTAVFFTLFIPVMFILIFGAFNSQGSSKIKLSLTDNGNSVVAHSFVKVLKSNDKIFAIKEQGEAAGRKDLDNGKTDVVVVVPANFGAMTPTGQLKPSAVQTYYNSGQPQAGQSAGLILSQIASGFNAQVTKSPQLLSVTSKGVSTHNLSYLDYLVPGILAMSIMQLGIMSIAFAFVSFKSSGALRRLHVTPTSPLAFLFGQSIARIIIAILQVALLLALSLALFHLHMVGSVVTLMILALVGTIVFLGFGFAIAGWARDENQAAPVANLVTFPMLFLSGTFFPRDSLPDWLHKLTGVLPLTYLADAMRAVSNQGSSLWDVRGDVLGLLVWGVIVYVIAIRVFKWE